MQAMLGYRSKPTQQEVNQAFRILLEYGSLVDSVDSDGNTVLHDAVTTGSGYLISLILEHPGPDGCDAVTRCRARNHRGDTPLQLAKGQPKIHRILSGYVGQ